jgi:hypothetical protein
MVGFLILGLFISLFQAIFTLETPKFEVAYTIIFI